MKIQLDLTDAQFDFLVRQAILLGFMREEPTKRWSTKERKEAVRFAFMQS